METVNIAIYIAIAVSAVYGILRGIRKGLYKSLIDLGVTIVAAVLSVFISKFIAKALVDVDSLISGINALMESSPDMVDALTTVKETIIELSENSNAVGMIMAFPAVILSPFIFMLVYLLIGALLKIPKFIVTRSIFGKNSGKTYCGGNRAFGGAIGAVVRVLSLAVFLVPLTGYINLADDMMTDISQTRDYESVEDTTVEAMSGQNLQFEENVGIEEEEDVDDEEYSEEASDEATEGGSSLADTIISLQENCIKIQQEYTEPMANNFFLKAIRACGGRWVFNSLSSSKVGDVKVTLSEEMGVIAKVFPDIVELAKVPAAEYGESQKQAINAIVETLDGAKVMPTVISGVISYTSKTWLDGGKAFGFEKINVGEYYGPTFDRMLAVLAKVDDSSIKKDIHTLGNVVVICIDEGFFVEVFGGGKVLDAVEKEAFMGKVFVELYDNDRTRPMLVYLVNSLKNYIYRVYNDVNDTNIPYPAKITVDMLDESIMYDEGARIASIIADFRAFYTTVNQETEDNTQFLIQTDVRSLGRALDNFEESVLLGDSYEFLLKAFLKSEGAFEIAFVTPDLIEMLLTTDSSMETVLVVRQKIAIIASTLEQEEKEDAIRHLLETVDEETADAIKSTISHEVLKNLGMSQDQSSAMSSTLESLIVELGNHDKDFTEEQKQAEVDAIDKLVTTVKDATDKNNEASNVFSNAGEEDSKTGMTATEVVETIVKSEIVSSAVNSATKDENGNKVEDPYKISNKMSEADKESAKSAIETYYSENSSTDSSNEELKQSLNSLAIVFGVEVNLE